MLDQAEIRDLICRARERGAIIRTWIVNGDITEVMIRKGVPDVGPGWMPLIAAAERLRKFLAVEATT